MKICVLGSSGLIGKPLVEKLRCQGHEVIRLVRSRENLAHDEIFWEPSTGKIDANVLEGVDAFINLAGENIASGRWTEAQKRLIQDSRVMGTHHLVRILTGLKNPPKVLVNASAIGYYGDRGTEKIDEESTPGDDFLATVCQKWEEATRPAEEHGIRVVKLRIGAVLSRDGGALAKMLLPFKLGLGGKIGSGDQYFSWIALDDLLEVICFALTNNELKGPVNVVAPDPVTNAAFTKALGNVLHRPTIFPLPAFAVRLMFGEMADAIMLGGAQVFPKKLLALGFNFKYPDIQSALVHCKI